MISFLTLETFFVLAESAEVSNYSSSLTARASGLAMDFTFSSDYFNIWIFTNWWGTSGVSFIIISTPLPYISPHIRKSGFILSSVSEQAQINTT